MPNQNGHFLTKISSKKKGGNYNSEPFNGYIFKYSPHFNNYAIM